jgi:hypothetical protein
MKLGFILFIGVFTNLLLASIFPYQLLPADDAALMVGGDIYGYDFSGSDYFGENQQGAVQSTMNELQSEESTAGLLATSQKESGILESVSFFDGLFDALAKAGTYIALVIPFSSVLFVLPGALGLILGGIYSLVTIYAIIRFIRGA